MSLKRIKLFTEFVNEEYSTGIDVSPSQEMSAEISQASLETEGECAPATPSADEEQEDE